MYPCFSLVNLPHESACWGDQGCSILQVSTEGLTIFFMMAQHKDNILPEKYFTNEEVTEAFGYFLLQKETFSF